MKLSHINGFTSIRIADHLPIVNNSYYVDRLRTEFGTKFDATLLLVFGNKGQYWYGRPHDKIQEFLRLLLDNPKLIFLYTSHTDNCGYPVHCFHCNAGDLLSDHIETTNMVSVFTGENPHVIWDSTTIPLCFYHSPFDFDSKWYVVYHKKYHKHMAVSQDNNGRIHTIEMEDDDIKSHFRGNHLPKL